MTVDRRWMPGAPGIVARLVLVALLLVGLVLALEDPFTVLFYGSYALAGALLVIRRPRNSIGWLLLVIGLGFIGTTVRRDLDLDALVTGTGTTRDFLLAWFGSWAGGLTFTAYLALTILFPSGHLPPGRARVLALAAIAVALGSVVLSAVAPTVSFNPDGGATDYTIPNGLAVLPDLPVWPPGVSGRLFLVPVALLAAGVIALVMRFRRSRGILRLQMRWLVASMAAIVAALLFGLASIVVADDALGGFGWIPAILAYPTVPIAIYVAVTRHGLYAIDRIISRTLSYALVTALLAAAFVGTNLALQAVVASATGGSTLTVAVSTLVVAALFQPVRRRIQAPVDRRFNRDRSDAERVVAAFTSSTRDEVDLAQLSGSVIQTAVETVRPAAAGLWLRRTA
jgi:hypothetical protein